jgi:hypothetical protein
MPRAIPKKADRRAYGPGRTSEAQGCISMFFNRQWRTANHSVPTIELNQRTEALVHGAVNTRLQRRQPP